MGKPLSDSLTILCGLLQTFGEKKDHNRSFYCTHISGVQRVANGNTLITMGPQGIMFEVTPEGEEVWRYINPVCPMDALGCTLDSDLDRRGCTSQFLSHYPAVSWLNF
jgi:hypothetical protein